MLTAREIAATGADVLLLERGSMGGESSWAGGGILSPLYPWRYDDAVNALASYSQRLYPAMAKELLAESEIDPEYNSCGLMVLDQNELVQAEKWAAKWHMNLEILDTGKLVQQVEPGLGAAVTNALWLPDIAQMRNPRLVKSLAGSLRKRHIKYLENCEVKRLVVSKNRVTGVVTGSGNYQANKIIIAGGAWSKNIIGIELPQPEIEPVKGQMILFRAKPGILSTMVLNQGRYLIPRRDG
ncbi:MAG: FAD-binding oxidoreductase, partial [Gammaproteobacteria bacterium]|nr:FAD-binding oxidoreductase [Gammaproteobacteria bacterium]